MNKVLNFYTSHIRAYEAKSNINIRLLSKDVFSPSIPKEMSNKYCVHTHSHVIVSQARLVPKKINQICLEQMERPNLAQLLPSTSVPRSFTGKLIRS